MVHQTKVFEGDGISLLALLFGALLPTSIAIAFFWLLRWACYTGAR